MKPIRSILTLQIPASMHSDLRGALRLALWLRADLHVLAHPERVWDARRHLTRYSRQTGASFRSQVLAWTGISLGKFLEAIAHHKIDLVLLDLDLARRAFSDRATDLERGIFEHCPVPILLIPRGGVEAATIDGLLVASSGERRIDDSIALAIHLANAARIPVDILHVTTLEGEGKCMEAPLETVKDEVHHEYSRLVDQLIAQASPFSTARERRCVRRFHQCRGDVTREIVRLMRATPHLLVLLEWKGALEAGRAATLRQVLAQASSPVLLIRPRAQQKARLLVGERFGR